MNFQTMYLICWFLAVVILGIAYSVTYHNTELKVKETSERYKYLLNLSQTLNAEILKPQYTYQKRMKSKAQFDQLNLLDLFGNRLPDYLDCIPKSDKTRMVLQNQAQKVSKYPSYRTGLFKQISDLLSNDILPSDLIQKAILNQRKLKEFEQKMEFIPPYQTPASGLYSNIEKKLTSEMERQIRPVVPVFIVSFLYTSPKGRNSYKRDQTFTLEMIKTFDQLAKSEEKLRKSEEKLRQKRQESVQYQRSLMTNSLRYDIMKRDGFRCVLCGARASDGVELHVDHIRPVSKGGKTEWKNLRTLCQRCNSGKRDKFDASGIN